MEGAQKSENKGAMASNRVQLATGILVPPVAGALPPFLHISPSKRTPARITPTHSNICQNQRHKGTPALRHRLFHVRLFARHKNAPRASAKPRNRKLPPFPLPSPFPPLPRPAPGLLEVGPQEHHHGRGAGEGLRNLLLRGIRGLRLRIGIRRILEERVISGKATRKNTGGGAPKKSLWTHANNYTLFGYGYASKRFGPPK